MPPSFDQMTPETLDEIRREQAAFARVFASPAAERFWNLPFIAAGVRRSVGVFLRFTADYQWHAARAAYRHGSLGASQH